MKAIDPKDAHILVIEDNLQNLVLITRLLDYIGIQNYEWKASGWQVKELLETIPRLDLVLMDLQLPHEDGFDVFTKLHSDSRFADTRVVMVTANADPDVMDKAKKMGFDGFVGKPIDPNKFPDQIIELLQGKQVWDLGY